MELSEKDEGYYHLSKETAMMTLSQSAQPGVGGGLCGKLKIQALGKLPGANKVYIFTALL